MNQDISTSKLAKRFNGRASRRTRVGSAVAAVLVTFVLFQTVATSFTSSASAQIAGAQSAKVIVASSK